MDGIPLPGFLQWLETFFLIKDVVLLATSIYLLKQDLVRVSASAKRGAHAQLLRA
jgi:hypothetical protein